MHGNDIPADNTISHDTPFSTQCQRRLRPHHRHGTVDAATAAVEGAQGPVYFIQGHVQWKKGQRLAPYVFYACIFLICIS